MMPMNPKLGMTDNLKKKKKHVQFLRKINVRAQLRYRPYIFCI